MASEFVTLRVNISIERQRELEEEVARRNAREEGAPWRSWKELAEVWAGVAIESRLEDIRERLGREAIAARDAEPASA